MCYDFEGQSFINYQKYIFFDSSSIVYNKKGKNERTVLNVLKEIIKNGSIKKTKNNLKKKPQ